MTESFAPVAVTLAGQSAWLLGWRPDDFWAATPAELTAIFAARAPADQGVSRTDFSALLERETDG